MIDNEMLYHKLSQIVDRLEELTVQVKMLRVEQEGRYKAELEKVARPATVVKPKPVEF